MELSLFNLPLAESLFALGVGLLVIEIVFLGFATFVLFFVGLALLITGGLMVVGVLPDSTEIAVFAVALLSIGSAILLWRPLKGLQIPDSEREIEVGFVGHRFQLNEDISPNEPGSYSYSGVEWSVTSAEPLVKSTMVKVVHAEVGRLIVASVET